MKLPVIGFDDLFRKPYFPGTVHMKTDEIEYDLILSKNDMLADVWLERSTALEEDTAKGLTHDDILARNY